MEKKKEREVLATEVAVDLQRGVVTDETVAKFSRLMENNPEPERPHFGTGVLPDDDW